MSEWWTYRLSDFLLFSPRTYYRLFELYNLYIWPAQIVTLALGVAVLALSLRPGRLQGRIVAAILAACWLLVAIAFHQRHYATINWAAAYAAFAFGAEALLLTWSGVIRGSLDLRPWTAMEGRIGMGVFVFALLLQPLIGFLVGRQWLQAEIFGVAPDPTVVATLGILLTADRVPWLLLVVPLAWCAVGGATLWAMEAADAWMLPLVGSIVLLLAVRRTLAARTLRPA